MENWSPSLQDGPVAQEPAFWLAREGRPMATIVIPSDPLDTHRQAAELLQEYVQKIAGARLEIAEETQAITGPAVVIGRTGWVDSLGLEIPAGYSRALNEEGYLIKLIGDRLVLVGNDHRRAPAYQGSLFAVVEILQRLGCRWYFPGAFGEVHPSSPDVSLPALDREVRPSLAVRGFWYGTAAERRHDPILRGKMERWQALNRFLPYGSVLPSATDESIMQPFRRWERREIDGRQVRVNVFFEERPDLFALNRDGTRNHAYLCLSHPAVLERVLAHAAAHFEKQPDSLAYSIAPPDGAPTCECEGCRGKNQFFMQKDPADPRIQDISGSFYWFMNEVAKHLETTHPEKWVSSTAYSGRIRPPEGIELRPNITLHTALLAHSRHHRYDGPTWHTRERVQLYRRWAALSEAIVEREYYPVFQFNCNVFQPMYRTSAFNIRFIADLGFRGAEWEGKAAFFAEGVSNYVRGQLLWNIHTDVEALFEDYYTRFYGAAGPVVRRFDEAVEKALTESLVDHHEEERIHEIYPYPFVVAVTDAVGEVAARVAGADAKTQARVAYFRRLVSHFRKYAEMRRAESDLDFIRAAELARAMIALEEEVDQINHTFIDSWNIFFDGRPVYGELGANATAHGKLKQYLAKQRLIDGTEGDLVAALPVTWQFKPDPHDEGVYFEWHREDAHGAGWRPMKTTASWEIQGMQDDQARGYDGHAWYRTTVTVPAGFEGRKLMLFLGGMNNQAWIWVNNTLAAAVPYHEYWERWKYHAQVDLSEHLKPGEENHIAIRVWNDQGAGGIFRRSFIYAPREEAQP